MDMNKNSAGHKCSECSRNLTTYEISDNIYVGIEENSYICYNCQTPVADDQDENPLYDDLNDYI